MKTQANKKNVKLRANIVGAIFFLALISITGRAAQLQIFQSPWLSAKAASQYERSQTIRGKRGAILDANRKPLAVSIDTTSVAAYPKQIENPLKAAKSLAAILKLNSKDVSQKLSSAKNFVWIKRQINPKEVQSLKSLSIQGVGFIPENSRVYPNKGLAAQVLGFSGIDGSGLEGIEYFYDPFLKGNEIQTTVLKDAKGRGFDMPTQMTEAYQGRQLVLTIDRNIQYITETALEEAVKKYDGKTGLAVVMAPKTGAVLAMAHYPNFNPNTFDAFDREVWRNRAITDKFEPGSTLKIFTAAAAIDSKRVTADTIFFCENGKYSLAGTVIHDTKPHGWLTLKKIVKYSSNIGAVKVMEAIGPEVLYDYLTKFGFGQKTGIDCPGETSGSLSYFNNWTLVDAGSISFGQGIAVSAIQLVAAASAIANDGLYMKPHMVQSIIDADGRTVKTFKPEVVRRVISAQTAWTVRKIMQSVVTEGGTGQKAALAGYSVGGKTGTAQKISENGGYAKDRFIASFIGFTPVEDPQAVILVVIDEPTKRHYGGTVAAPVFRKIAHATLQYRKVTPTVASKDLRLAAFRKE
jgi:cell division protein FtsI (penicillin-binding protein 3)